MKYEQKKFSVPVGSSAYRDGWSAIFERKSCAKVPAEQARREIFDRVKAHLLKQGRRAEQEDDGRCRYRNAAGLKCAVGCLLTDEAYSPVLEGCGVSSPCLWDALKASGVPADKKTLCMLGELQELHDHLTPASWATALDDLETYLQEKELL